MHKRLVKLLLPLGLLLLSFWVGKLALADFYYQRAKTTFESLDLETLSYSHELEVVVKDVNRSLSLRRSTADALDLKGDLLYQSWWLSPDGQYLQDSRLLQNAVALHVEAQEQRAGWAFSAARLALIYSHQSKLDFNFDEWFVESHRLGLYETTVARSLMIVGLQNWGRLSTQQQKLTMDFVRTSIEQKANSPEMMIMLLDRYKMRHKACGTFPDTQRKINVCQGGFDNSVRIGGD